MRKFDKEYRTMFLKEKDYLDEQGIYPSFTKIENEVIVYKYTKTEKLFKCLADFYSDK